MAATNLDCEICCNEVSKLVICHKCTKGACVKCYKNAIKEQTEDASCIFCKTQFYLEFLIANFGQTYIWAKNPTNYRAHRENMLLDQQLTLLPDTQIIVQRDIEIDKLRTDITKIKAEIRGLNITPQMDPSTSANPLLNNNQLVYNHIKILNLYTSQSMKELEIKRLKDLNDGILPKDPEKEAFLTRGHCPKEGCNGFIIDKWTCGICDTKVCSTCLETIGTSVQVDKNHVCDEGVAKNVEEIRANTKPCPSCRVKVFKIEGCYQMFCTNCKVFFDWTKLTIIKKTAHVHNPHYTEWVANMNSTGQDTNGFVQGVQCAEGLTYESISDACGQVPVIIGGRRIYNQQTHQVEQTKPILEPFDIKKYNNKLLRDVIIYFFQRLNHLQDYGNVARLEEELNIKLLNLRKQYLRNRLTKYEFKRQIQMVYKQHQKSSELNDIKTTCFEYFSNLLRMYLEGIKSLSTDLSTDLLDFNQQRLDHLKLFIERVEKYYDYTIIAIGKMFKLYGSTAQINIFLAEPITNIKRYIKKETNKLFKVSKWKISENSNNENSNNVISHNYDVISHNYDELKNSNNESKKYKKLFTIINQNYNINPNHPRHNDIWVSKYIPYRLRKILEKNKEQILKNPNIPLTNET